MSVAQARKLQSLAKRLHLLRLRRGEAACGGKDALQRFNAWRSLRKRPPCDSRRISTYSRAGRRSGTGHAWWPSRHRRARVGSV